MAAVFKVFCTLFFKQDLINLLREHLDFVEAWRADLRSKLFV